MDTQRDAFWQRVYQLARADRNVLVVSADMGAPSLDRFRRDLGDQYVDVGIAEQQAVSAAAGLTLAGKKVFAYAIAPFITLRCYEHIRLSLGAMNIPVTLVGVGAGFSYDDSGPTHHTIEDISALRVFPNLLIHNMTDSVMADAFADISCGLSHPNYIRLDRKPLPNLYKKGHDFSPGLHVFAPAGDICLVATGNMTHRALELADDLKKQKIQAGVVDVYTLPINADGLLSAIGGAKMIFTLEEHVLPGGFGSAVCEVLADAGVLKPVKRFGLQMRDGYCYNYGGRENILLLYGLDRKSLLKSILDCLAKGK
jgi:transketolase